ncbi:MAG: PspA/IM30 family protein [Chloroflexi bacterium]|nr:PspA/IM30 family protein [Chloroflexota bacterium]MDA8189163.1 PspA/IM30 family protein [Dehalococcoidales bacterium]
MGLLSRMSTLLKAKMSAFLERAEDPRQTLDYSYEKQLELLQNVKRGIVDVVTSKRRLELQEETLKQNVAKLDDQARRALAAGREDLARTALERKQVILTQLQDLDNQITALQTEQDKLAAAESRLSTKVEAFRTKKETIKAQYSAAEAQVRIGEAVTGISEEMADVGYAVQHAEDKTEKLRARAGAIDELVAAGTLEDTTGTPDVVERELQKISVSQSVDQELARMKQQLQAPQQPKQLEEGK